MFLYIDATTGGIMLQVILSGAVGGIVFFRLAAGRIVNFFLRRKDAPVDDIDDASSPDDGEDSTANAA